MLIFFCCNNRAAYSNIDPRAFARQYKLRTRDANMIPITLFFIARCITSFVMHEFKIKLQKHFGMTILNLLK